MSDTYVPPDLELLPAGGDGRSLLGPGDECYHCGRANPAGARYCGGCGHRLEVSRCGTCLKLIEPGSHFCGRCGAALGAPGTLPGLDEEQVRQVTVLFALLSDLHLLVEQFDPEELKDLLDDCFRILTGEIQARGGTIDKYMADSLLALFGVPVAHEDDPDRAVSAALAMLDALDAFNRRLFASRGFQLGIKIGINTGKVLVGYVATDAQSLTVMGDVVNTASRVEHAAPVGGILICESTRRHLGDRFPLRPQPPLLVKGKQEPLTVYRVLREATEGREGRVDLSQVPLLGREQELEQLVLAWRRLVRPEEPRPAELRPEESGHPEVRAPGVWVTLLGDVGLGKDRLLREFQEYAASDPCRPRLHTTRASSFAAGGGEMLRRLIRSLVGVRPGEGTVLELERILAAAHRIAGPDPETGEVVRAELAARAISMLAGLVSPGSGDQVPPSEPRSLRAQGVVFLRALVARLAEVQPLLIVASELQWADEAALDFLEALGNQPPPGVMVLTSARPSLLDRRPGWGRGNPTHLLLRLNPLSFRDVQVLVRSMYSDRTVSPRLVEALYRFTGGNPFYLLETLRYHMESRGATQAGDDELSVPDSIEGVLQSRLDRLSFEAGLTLRAAAVIGPVFWRGALTAVLGSDRAEGLERLIEGGFIHRRESSQLPGEEEYVFEHVMTARVAAGNLLESVRRRYHLAAADWLISRSGGPLTLERGIAHHLEAAGELTRAAPWFVRAGDRALETYECAEAVRLFDKAQAGLEAADGWIDPSLQAHLLAQRGNARRMLADFEPALSDFQQAAAAALSIADLAGAASAWYRAGLIYHTLGAIEPATRAADTGDRLLRGLSAPAIEAIGLHLRAELLIAGNQLPDARQPLERAILLARRTGDRWGLAHSLNALGRLQMGQADYAAAQRTLKEAMTLREALGDIHGLASTLHNLGAAAGYQGLFTEALGHYHRSMRLWRRLENRSGLAGTLMNQGTVYARCGYYGRARVALEESLELYHTLQRPWGVAACQGNLGHFWLQLRQLGDAGRYLTQAVDTLRSLGDEQAEVVFLVDLAVCRLLEGRIDEAETLSRDAFQKVRKRPGSLEEALVLQLLAMVALGRGSTEEALEYVEELEWSDPAQATPELQVRTALLAGRIALARARPPAAAARFEEAAHVAEDRDLVPAMWEARALRKVALERAGQPFRAAEEAMAEALREFLARVEDVEISALVKQLTTKVEAPEPVGAR